MEQELENVMKRLEKIERLLEQLTHKQVVGTTREKL